MIGLSAIHFPKQRYRRRFAVLSLIYVAAVVGIDQLFRAAVLGGVARYAAAIVPALPILAMFVATGRYLHEERDEFLRMLMVRQTLVASAFALSLATIWGFLESFGLVMRAEVHWVGLLWFGSLGMAALFHGLTRSAHG